MSFTVFVRNWWRENKAWPGGREPESNARRTVIARNIKTEDEAREIARAYNKSHEPGFLSRKAEFTED